MSLHESSISFRRPDGKECSGFYVEPAAGKSAPGVVVIQEWWGLNDQIRGVARRLAEAGYRALVPDLYRGKIGLDAKEAEHLMSALDFGDAASQDIRGAAATLKASSSRVGAVGFCMGGALTLLSVVHVPEIDAAVTWYGFPPLDYIDATRIKAPIQGHFAMHDAFFPIGQVDSLEQKLRSAHVQFEFYKYDAQHAFGNETLENPPIPAKHDPSAAALAWERTLNFYKRHLVEAAPLARSIS